jgi:hypothetical protein
MLAKKSGLKSQVIYMIRRLSALGRVREDIMDQQKAPRKDMPGPGIVIRSGGLHGMPTVNKDQT